jgi:hypothetical protein
VSWQVFAENLKNASKTAVSGGLRLSSNAQDRCPALDKAFLAEGVPPGLQVLDHAEDAAADIRALAVKRLMRCLHHGKDSIEAAADCLDQMRMEKSSS